MARAVWPDTVLTKTDRFPADLMKRDHFRPSSTTSLGPRKGTEHGRAAVVEGVENLYAAWYYPDPRRAAENVWDRVAFRLGGEVEG